MEIYPKTRDRQTQTWLFEGQNKMEHSGAGAGDCLGPNSREGGPGPPSLVEGVPARVGVWCHLALHSHIGVT